MNMFKKNGGFTLVELIVVIAILAILAGVAVPAYTGYITRANDAAVISELDALKTAALSANATNGDISKITCTITDKKVTKVTIESGNELAKNIVADFKLYYDSGASGTLADKAKSVEITLGTSAQISVSGTSYDSASTLTWDATNGWK